MIDLPNIRQTTDFTCGAASLLSVLNYYGLYEDSEMVLANELATSRDWGTDPINIIKVANKYGLETQEHINMTMQQLEDYVKAGIPVLVAYQAWSESDLDWSVCWDDGHYSVVVGMDADKVYFEDPSLGAGEVGFIPRVEFVDRWHDIDHDGEPLYQYGVALSYPEHPFFEMPMQRVRKID
jgi:predicted double-glycine peptidase